MTQRFTVTIDVEVTDGVETEASVITLIENALDDDVFLTSVLDVTNVVAVQK